MRGLGRWRGLVALLLSVAAFMRFSALFPRLLKRDDFQSSKFLRPLQVIRVKLLNPAIVWGIALALAIPLAWPSFGGGTEDEAMDPATHWIERSR